jgi:hypothetical protein
VLVVLGVAAGVFWDDLQRTALDPKTPFQIYRPPPAPDYASRGAWALLPDHPETPTTAEPPVDIFFISPTTYNGGRDWNAPIDDRKADRLFREVMAPNYAGPFVRIGRLFAPRYRQASLYSLLTLREDARDARRFAYGDVARAFQAYMARDNGGRPFILVGVEQGGALGARLLADEITAKPAVRDRLVVAYLIDTVVPADSPPAPPCRSRGQTGCVAAWMQVPAGDESTAHRALARALVWNPRGELENLHGRPALCFNPVLGVASEQVAAARLNLGAANATGLEWDARPAFLGRQVSSQCIGGLLQVTEGRSASLRPSGSWAARRREPGYNLFYADIENDAKIRTTAMSLR